MKSLKYFAPILLACALCAGPALKAESVCSSAPKNFPMERFAKGGIYHNLAVNCGAPYKVADDEILRFDISYPAARAPKGGFPLIVYFHGGAWQGGERYGGYGFFNDEIRRYNSEGIAVATVSYRFAKWSNPRRAMDVCVIDVMDALRYFTKHCRSLKINPDKIGVYGHSAGGHLAFMAALADQSKFLGDPDLQGVKYKIACAVPQSGPTSFVDDPEFGFEAVKSNAGANLMRVPLGGDFSDEEFRALLSPALYASKNAPKMLILHGDKDTIVPVSAAIYIDKKLKAAGAKDVSLVIAKNARHSFEDAKDPDNDALANIRQKFFIDCLAR